MAQDIFTILRRKYPEREYALMQEVSDAAGFSRSRSADFVLVNLWPSRGLAISGIELKSFRSDWLNELKKPEKAENIFKYCDYFWLLTTDDTIAKIEEIPINWGWMCIKGERIIIKKQAPVLTPTQISRGFLCAMLKRAQDKTHFVHINTIQDKINEALERGREENKRLISKLEKELSELRTAVNDFEQASGIDLKNYYRWETNPKTMGEAVKFIENGGAKEITQQLLNLEKTAHDITEKISNGLKVLQQQRELTEEKP